jgi:hypothetical protein
MTIARSGGGAVFSGLAAATDGLCRWKYSIFKLIAKSGAHLPNVRRTLPGPKEKCPRQNREMKMEF